MLLLDSVGQVQNMQRIWAVKVNCAFFLQYKLLITLKVCGWLGSRVVSVLDSGAEGPGTNRSRDAVG